MANRRPSIIIVGMLVLGLGVIGTWVLSPKSTPAVPEGLTEVTAAEEIKQKVELSHIGIATSTNYLGHKVYLVHGTLKNISATPLRLVDVKMSFVDHHQKPVEESVHKAFEPKWNPLEPGTEYRFEMAFENLPRTWNYRVPNIAVVKVAY
jgi:hypothetical protein